MTMKKRVLVVLASAVVAVPLGVGVAYASIPAADGTIHGCYQSSGLGDGGLYVIDSGDSCPTGYTTLDWNKTGPAGVSGYEVVTDSATVPPNTARADVTVNCPTGKVALGGGGSSETLELSKPVVASGNAVGWEAQGRRADPNSGNPLTATAWAICATVAP